jgi:hypothetical protein
MGLFTTHKITLIEEPKINKVNRQPVSSYIIVNDPKSDPEDPQPLNIKCRFVRTMNEIYLFVIKNQYLSIPGGLHKNYHLTIEGLPQIFNIKDEPSWAGGIRHHIEAVLEELV